MNLDDRMRQAHQRQLDAIVDGVTGTTFSPTPESRLRRAAPALAVVVAVVLVFVGAITFRDRDDAVVESVDQPEEVAPDPQVDVADEPSEPLRSTQVPNSEASPTTVAPESEEPPPASEALPPPEDEIATDGSAEPDVSIDEESTDDDVVSPQTTAAATEPEPESTPDPEPEPEPEDEAPVVEPGVPSAKCPSGARAEVEKASLRYIGENEGWNRLDDLVDEQETEFEFEAWEPNYPNPVTVEVLLPGLVSAVDIRVSQDPFTPVSGDIEIMAFRGDEIIGSFTIALDGLDGWREHTFPEPTTIDRFLITRRVETANIMEVMVCVESTS